MDTTTLTLNGDNYMELKEGDVAQIECRTFGGVPVPSLHIYLDGRDISADLHGFLTRDALGTSEIEMVNYTINRSFQTF